MTTKEHENICGEVDSPEGIRKISQEIRRAVDGAASRWELTEQSSGAPPAAVA